MAMASCAILGRNYLGRAVTGGDRPHSQGKDSEALTKPPAPSRLPLSAEGYPVHASNASAPSDNHGR